MSDTEEMTGDYDAGLLNDYGGGDVDWWWDYIRAEIGRCNDYHKDLALEQAAALTLAREALSPLAVMADRYDPDDGDGGLECWSGLAVPKIHHIRAARAALDAIDKLTGAK